MEYLFNSHLLSERLKNHKINMVRETESENPEYILKVSINDYCEYLTSKYSEVVPTLYDNKAYILKPEEVRKNGSNRPTLATASMLTGETIITIAIPYEGNGALFECMLSTSNYNPPRGNVKGQELHLQYGTFDLDPDAIKKENQKRVEQIKKYLEWIKVDVQQHNVWINKNVKEKVVKRRRHLIKTKGFLESIGLPIAQARDLPTSLIIPVDRKKIKISRPVVTSEPYEPEPTLEETEYEYILETLSNMSLAMERSPRTFSGLHEDAIRDFFLIILNGHYMGQATGETFNVSGKTDILINFKGKNAFIAECKIWDGPKSLLGAIDQILGYTSWRDTKTAILILNKDREFSQIIGKIDETVKSHKCYKRQHELKNKELENETVFSYIFHQPKDKNREIIMTIMAFNIPKMNCG